jgi:hypothetical protein
MPLVGAERERSPQRRQRLHRHAPAVAVRPVKEVAVEGLVDVVVGVGHRATLRADPVDCKEEERVVRLCSRGQSGARARGEVVSSR